MNIICLDIETTGLNHYDDEILQLSIIDGSGAILFNEYVKPVRHECWTDAEKVNHISPSMVKDCKPLLYYAHTIQHILENADMIVGYNIHGFDLPFIFNSGIEYHAKENSIVVDVMLAFAEIYGQKRYNEYKWQKLKTCAEYYSYSEDSWHNALDDAKATLFCFYKIFGDVPEVPVYATGVYRSVDNIIKHEDQKPVEVVPIPKSGNILIGFGIFMLLGFFVAFNPVCIVIAAPLLYFGFKRHKAYKEFKQNKRKQRPDQSYFLLLYPCMYTYFMYLYMRFSCASDNLFRSVLILFRIIGFPPFSCRDCIMEIIGIKDRFQLFPYIRK